MSIHLFPIDQLWHPCHLQQFCWFPFILAVLDHLEQERCWKAAAFFPETTKINAVSGKDQKKGTRWPDGGFLPSDVGEWYGMSHVNGRWTLREVGQSKGFKDEAAGGRWNVHFLASDDPSLGCQIVDPCSIAELRRSPQ